MAVLDRPAVTRPVVGSGPVGLRSSFVSDRTKERERVSGGTERRTDEEDGKRTLVGSGGRVVNMAKNPRGFIEFAVSAPYSPPPPRSLIPYTQTPVEPHPNRTPLRPLSFQCEHPESDSTMPAVRHWETAALPPAIETRGFPAKKHDEAKIKAFT